MTSTIATSSARRGNRSRSIVAAGLLLAMLVIAIVGWRRHRSAASALAVHEDERASSVDGGRQGLVPGPRDPRRTALARRPLPAVPMALAPAPREVEAGGGESARPRAEKARDIYYERLLAMQGRDQKKEEQLQQRLMAAFGDDPDTLVGSVACSPEFCRIELRGFGEVDIRQRWEDKLSSAVEPRGLRFIVSAKDEEDTTIASCYFGRSHSWTVPDFHALGLI